MYKNRVLYEKQREFLMEAFDDSALGELQEWIDKGVVPLPTADDPDAEIAWDECTKDQLVDAWVQYKIHRC